jgi:hypothetical protein
MQKLQLLPHIFFLKIYIMVVKNANFYVRRSADMISKILLQIIRSFAFSVFTSLFMVYLSLNFEQFAISFTVFEMSTKFSFSHAHILFFGK